MLGGGNWEFYLSDPFISKRCFDRTVLTFFKLVLDESFCKVDENEQVFFHDIYVLF